MPAVGLPPRFAFALGVVRLARKRALVQELPAVETLARVDVICLDKTGTITYGDLAVTELRQIGEAGDERVALGALASLEASPNATLLAIAAAFPAVERWACTTAIPFSSARKWSAANFDGRGTWVLGAPEVLLPLSSKVSEREALQREVDKEASTGSRVLLLGHFDTPLDDDLQVVEPRGLVLLSDRVREDADVREPGGSPPTTKERA
jgi:cation-transporting P-type ATPase E